MKFVAVLALLLSTHLSFAADLCQRYFVDRDHDIFLTEILHHAPENNTPAFWIATLQHLAGNSPSFPFAKEARFRFSKTQSPEYRRHFLLGIMWRASRVQMPKTVPADKQELSQFLADFAYALELHLANKNVFSFPLKASYSYLKSRHTLESRRLKRLEKVEGWIQNSQVAPAIKPFLKLYLIYHKVKTALHIQRFEADLRSRFGSMFPWHYNRDVNFILKHYDQDIRNLVDQLQRITGQEIILSARTVQERNWMLHVANGIFQTVIRPFLPPFAPVTFWEPLRRHDPLAPKSQTRNWRQPLTWLTPTQAATTMKYVSDQTVLWMRTLSVLLFASIVHQSVMDTLMFHDFLKANEKFLQQSAVTEFYNKPTLEQTEQNYLDHIARLEKALIEQKEKLKKTQNETEINTLKQEIEEYEMGIQEAKSRLRAWKLSLPVNAH